MTPAIDRRTEIQIGSSWTDVTADVREATPIRIERGAKDEATRPGPSKLSLTLNNRHGRYSPRNPRSPYFELIGRNTPIRVSVKGPESYLALEGTTTSYARTPDAAALDITGDIDLRVEATADWYASGSQSLLGKWDSAANQRSYLLRIENQGILLNWSTAGTVTLTAQQPLPALPKRAALRVTLDVNNGASGYTAAFYWAPSLAGPWVQIGAAVTSTPATSIYAGTVPLEIAPIAATGVTPVLGKVHRAEVRSGIGGTVVASPDVRALAEGATGFTDTAGRVWTLGADASISDRLYRFRGEVNAWPPRWDVSGSDVYVPLEAAGVTRRMGQGKKALGSTLARRVPAFQPLAYWPCEDDDGASQAYSPIAGVSPLVVSGWRFGQDSTLAGSSPLPSVEAGATMRGDVPVPAVTPTEWSVHMVYAVDAPPVSDGVFLTWRATGTVKRWQILQRSGLATIRGYDSDNTLIVDQAVAVGDDIFEGWQRFYFRLSASGGTVTWHLAWWNIGGSAGGVGSTYSGSTGRVTQIDTQFGASVTGLRVGHIAVLPTAVNIAYTSADHGFSGDTALDRLYRLANEESDQVEVSCITGDPARPSEQLGPQRPDTLLNLLEEAAATDGGILYERLDRLALVYRDRTSLYNQPVRLALDYTAKGEVPPPLTPTEDDQKIRNDVTVTRSGGSSGRAVLKDGPLSVRPPPDGVGLYDEAVTLSLRTDTQPPLIAQWRMHLGTWDEARYPVITVWLHAAPHLVDDVLDLDIGDRVTISNPPDWLPPGLIDQHMRGYTEVLGLFEWTLAMNCSPAGPWTVGVLEDQVLGRADTDGAVLSANVTSTATLLSVSTVTGPVWTTDPADVPMDVQAGGEVMTVSAIQPRVRDAFGRTVASGWGSADSGQTWTVVGAAADYAVGSGYGSVAQPSTGVAHLTLAPAPSADIDLYVDVASSVLAAGASLFAGPLVRAVDNSNHYAVRVDFTTSAGVVITIRKRVAGTETQLGTFTSGLTHIAGTFYRVRFQVYGTALKARIWLASGAEPAEWQIEVADSALTAAANVGTRSFSNTGSTPVNPQLRFDNFQIVNPQAFTVTRSVNTIIKAQTAGTPLSLTHPMRAAL